MANEQPIKLTPAQRRVLAALATDKQPNPEHNQAQRPFRFLADAGFARWMKSAKQWAITREGKAVAKLLN